MKITQVWLILAIILMFGLPGCSSAPVVTSKASDGLATPQQKVLPRDDVAKTINDWMVQPYADTLSVEVLYATNRNLLGAEAGCTDRQFGIDVAAIESSDSKGVTLGSCLLNVPKKHVIGDLKFEANPRADSHEYFKVLSHKKLSTDELSASLLQAGEKGFLVFVHGFNVKFEEAVLRAAQIAYDLKFQGKVLLISWPAGAGDSLFAGTMLNRTYQSNKSNAEKSVEFMVNQLKMVQAVANTGVPVFLAIHSMGHQVVLPALGLINADGQSKLFRELVMNAPDFPIDEFQKLSKSVVGSAKHVTLYCSYNDKAMTASETMNKNKRLGECARTDGIDVINVGETDSSVLGLGHGYYSGRAILTDLSQMLLGLRAESRLFIRRSEPNSPEDFFLRP